LLSSPDVVEVLSHVISGDIAIDQITIKQGAKVVGRTISEIDLGKNTGASILSIIRQTQMSIQIQAKRLRRRCFNYNWHHGAA
jgi:K+/H+ antiporter YhaU regulatory subunit KhtT